MAVRQLAEDLYVLPGLVNIYILRTLDGLALIDTGFPGSAKKVLAGVAAIGAKPQDVRHILVTHAHPDHIGSAAALKQATGARVWAHAADAPIIEAGTGFRDVEPCPGLRNRILYTLLRGRILQVDPVEVDGHLADGESPDFLPDLTALHMPGHCAGQLGYMWNRQGGIFFPADSCVHRRGKLHLPFSAESLAQARANADRMKQRDFEMICVMHGRPILSGGSRMLRATTF